ncbi:MAG: 4-hydroxy-tetrahydrodipicolinate synthase [Sphaerochaeta sp.]|jgi:4-hydroxy-tetrahydrodipicolinate synthase|nr:4-hydroxy-tetrahydrodipicolinate synthase [Sphaerochaeta sp.]MCH3920401.1 4-hydroxy-tetrahydrodipicolinate synthase [Sphaerochaeta sp.]MCI2044953.1 4-hydroxy-tetrahydrodipicolinate synthase [Sphaerochaeta sp.]MCI2076292.1 4-hydroxy-tetrahydrodipicolinate synthase [Sphaerochaeta sp.]MCI2096548.1 4-hydroxy-tetrahydrodipicolinate synthase [Sphaerochaeta sp.]
MEKITFRGVYTAMVTPFTKTDNIDEQALYDMINSQIASGVSGLVPCGTSGESPTLSHLEHDRVIALTVHYAKGRVPVIAGTGSNATSEAIQLSRHAQTNGADACLLVNPYYNKPTQKGLYLHFKAVADSVDIPCILYNIKGRTGVNIETDTLVKLANDCPNIVGVKEASGNLVQMEDVIKRKPSSFAVLSGDDNLSLDLIERGGDGVVSVASNICPALMSKMIGLALDGKMAEARKIEEKLAPFFKACFIETNPIPIKTAMARYGWCEESFRLPLCTLATEEHRQILYQALDDLDAIGAIVRR